MPKALPRKALSARKPDAKDARGRNGQTGCQIPSADIKAILTGGKAEPIYIPFAHLRPTQVAVGMRAVAAKRAKVKARAMCERKLESYLRQRPLPAVRGPNGHIYLVDKHHLGLALVQNRVDGAYVEFIDDLSHLSAQDFWAVMEAEGRTYLFDESGQRVPPLRLPKMLRDLHADPYRDLAWTLREAGCFKKVRVPFSEFRWAAFFRARIEEKVVRANYPRAVEIAAALAATKAASTLPGYLR
ncbi:MAG: hypothetical protein EKK41_11995 [Hyphomicrobiales bacterium]|nr:MAG: hypothetical protein EKK41_11995 [Hyphomicrobiales bacterium]